MNIDYKIYKSSRKTLSIKVQNGEVIVKAPLKCSDKMIADLIQEKQSWTNKHLDIESKKPRLSFNHGDTIPFLGKSYKLIIVNKSLQDKVILDDKEIIVFSKKDDIKNHEKLLINWFKKEATEFISDRYKSNASLFDYKKVPPLKIRDFKSRWGSYHKKGLSDQIKINWKLIMYPALCIDYVIIHELAHKTHNNHSKDFHNLVEIKFPNWKTAKNILDSKN
ncbi:MAG: M48 family metallopeptidase [Alphaproteobacteria bacterium]|jgi:predicted metal-dependent hydrolase|nr:M48 family metallopeptidase [Alphaproteobacteria bacterium]